MIMTTRIMRRLCDVARRFDVFSAKKRPAEHKQKNVPKTNRILRVCMQLLILFKFD